MSPALVFAERSRPQAFLCVAPFALWFLVTSFLPDTLTPKPVIFDIPVRGTDLGLLCAALMSFGGWFFAGRLAVTQKPWHRNIPLWFALILGYAAISILWSGMDVYNSRAMSYSLAFAAGAFLLPFSVIASLTPGQVRRFARWLALGLAAIGLVYCAISFFGLSVRTELGHFYDFGFGIERVKGPLFEASTGHMILLPAAGVLLQDWFDGTPDHSAANAAGLAALSITILGLGSRFALIVTGLFVLAIIVAGRGARSRKLSVAVLAGLALSAAVLFQYASGERLRSFQDPQRASTYTTSLNIVEDRQPALNLAGSGYGSIWPWYMTDWTQQERIARGYMMTSTDYGTMLFQPHSVFLLLTVELGAAGLLFFVFLWKNLVSLVSRAAGRQQNVFAALGIACASLGMLADTILFKNPKVSSVWWFFLLAALALRDGDGRTS